MPFKSQTPVFLVLIMIFISGCSSARTVFENDLKEMVRKQGNIPNEKISAQELKHLPEPVRDYLIKSGFSSGNKIKWVHAKYKGQMSMKRNQAFVPIECEQYNSEDQSTRLWYGKVMLAPFIYFEARHIYSPEYANMLVKFGPFTIIDIKGKEISQSDMITFYNDMILFMPTGLLSSNVSWHPIDTRSAKAFFTNNGRTASAIFYFNDKNELTNFITDDRYMLDGTNITRQRWSTPIREYRLKNGLKEITHGDAVWKLPEGDYTYFRINDPDMEIEYNVLPKIKP